MKDLIIRIGVALLIGFYLISHPAQGATCVQTPDQLKDLLYQQQIAPNWAEFIQGHWSVNPKGSGFHIFVHRSRYVIGINAGLLGKDAKYVDICQAQKPGQITVSGRVLGQSVAMNVTVQGNQLVVRSNGPGNGTFTKRSKSLEQIRQEFADQLKKL